MNNDEQLKTELKITELYYEILKRQPDPAGMEYYKSKILKEGKSFEWLEKVLHASPEAKSKIPQNIENNKTQSDLDQQKISIQHTTGDTLFLNPDDKVLVKSLNQSHEYEKGTVSLVSKLVKNGMNVINIGANIGYFTILLASLVGNNGKVFAFEPLPISVEFLKKNVEFNDYKNTEIIKKGVSQSSGKQYLQVAPSSVHNYISSTNKGLSKIEIDVTSVDDFLESKDVKIDLIVMDAEGSEKNILEGMQKTLQKNPKLEIITEFNPFTLELTGTNSNEFLELCEKLKLSLYLINEKNGNITPVSKEELMKIQYPKYVNLYLKKSN